MLGHCGDSYSRWLIIHISNCILIDIIRIFKEKKYQFFTIWHADHFKGYKNFTKERMRAYKCIVQFCA